jgi:hypothetical protein
MSVSRGKGLREKFQADPDLAKDVEALADEVDAIPVEVPSVNAREVLRVIAAHPGITVAAIQEALGLKDLDGLNHALDVLNEAHFASISPEGKVDMTPGASVLIQRVGIDG